MNPSTEKNRILLFTDWFLPGFKGGGPIQTIAGMIEHLAEDVEFSIVTRDRDLGSLEPYPTVEVDTWSTFGDAKIYYWSPGLTAKVKLLLTLRRFDYEVLYLNGVFSVGSTILPLICHSFGLLKRGKVVIAPRGELSKGALGLKRRKKKLFLATAKLLGLYANVQWHVSSYLERKEVTTIFGESGVGIVVAPNLSPKLQGRRVQKPAKIPGLARMVTLSRISRKKNIDFTLKYSVNKWSYCRSLT